MLFYCVCITAVYFIAGNQFQTHQDPNSISAVEAVSPVGEIIKTSPVAQSFTAHTDNISAMSFKLATYNRTNRGQLKIQLFGQDKKTLLFEKEIDVSTLKDNTFFTVEMENPIQGTNGKSFYILFSSESTDKANAVTVYYNPAAALKGAELSVGQQKTTGELCFTVSGTKAIFFGRYYFEIMGAVGLLLALYCIRLCKKEKTGQKSLGLSVIKAFEKYKFLLDQLVDRDFKTKYKRSVLGVLWSFLNPLLTMMVQYIVFSTIFKSNIDNYPVYLLTGIVFFNFFSEAVGMALGSIVGSSSLITKVYIPKYIFPISRVMSSAINFFLSLIPLFIAILLTGTAITPAILLLPFAIACTILFCIGMGMLLASSMVFFRDTQFLWNVVSLLWMYATPLFYPEDIIPAKYALIFKLNPMYHFIRFARTVIESGVSPEPQAYLFCIVAAVVPFLLGAFVFKKTQDKFVLYI